MHAKQLAWAWDIESYHSAGIVLAQKLTASEQTLPQWKMKATPAFLWAEVLEGPLVAFRVKLAAGKSESGVLITAHIMKQ